MNLGRWLGINVSAHWSVLVLAYVIFNNVLTYLEGATTGFYFSNLLLTSGFVSLGLLLSILAHEFGHIIIGRMFGVSFDSVILHVFGGAARMSGSIPNPKAEALMATAGPATSFILSLGLFVLAALMPVNFQLTILALMLLSAINFTLGLFNLIPAYPMDGGRVVRAAVWHWTKSFMKATKFASVSGQTLGAVFIGMGITMALGIHVPFFGVGLGDGIWIGVLGGLIMLMAFQELKHYRQMGYR